MEGMYFAHGKDTNWRGSEGGLLWIELFPHKGYAEV